MIKDILRHIGDVIVELFGKEEWWLVLLFVGLGLWIVAAFFDTLWAIIKNFIVFTWPVWVFFILLPIFSSLWLFWRQALFKQSIRWVVLELKIPRIVEKSAQAMEQVLAGIQSLRNAPGDIREKYWDGEVTRWYALEMVSFGGEIRFYVRVYAKQKNLVEAAFFSYYPDVEVVEVEDYAERFPKTVREMYENNMEIWGTEMVLSKEDAYPIKTYEDFEHEAEEKQFDPISTFLEVLGKVKPGEVVGIQILAAPAGSDWKKKFDGLLEDLKKPSTTKVKVSSEEGEEEREVTVMRSPGHTEILEKVEENLSKPAFATLVRFVYLSPKEIFYDSFARRGLRGAFSQYSALNLNSFRDNRPMSTRTRFWNWPHIFPKVRNEFRKQRLLHNYRIREVPPETWVGRLITSYLLNWNFASKRFFMNTKCLATLFHPPTKVVLTAPHIRRVESRKTGPPAGLAIYGEEGEIGHLT